MASLSRTELGTRTRVLLLKYKIVITLRSFSLMSRNCQPSVQAIKAPTMKARKAFDISHSVVENICYVG